MNVFHGSTLAVPVPDTTRYARANDQIAFVSQAALDASLSFVRSVQLPDIP